MQIVIQPVLWSSEPDITDTAPLSDQDIPLLVELRAVLQKYGATDRFGIQLLHRHFDIAEDERLIEDIDVENRILTIRPERTASLSNTVTTAWRFKADDADPTPALGCRWECIWEGSRHVGQRHWATAKPEGGNEEA